MGATRFADIPDNVVTAQAVVASAASNGTGGDALTVAQQAGYLKTARIIHTGAHASAAASDGKTLKVINLGSAATGTTVLASYAIPAATKAALLANAFTVGAATAATFSAGDVIQYVIAPGTAGNVTYAAGIVALELSYT